VAVTLAGLRAAAPSVLVAFAACAAPSPEPAITFDVCRPIRVAPIEATGAQLASLDDAIAMWRALGVTTLARGDGADAAITLEFRAAAPAFHGFYDPATAIVYVNTDLDDGDQRAITIAHELGHAFGLPHVPATERSSLMNPGNLTIPPDDGDRGALDALWGACP
jgi:hypothetical protein